MKSRTEIIRQAAVNGNRDIDSVRILDKDFVIAPQSDMLRVIVHEDYPMIEENDLHDFISYSEGKDVIVISGSQAKVHPYRLMYIEDGRYDAHLLNIPQSIRGNRQSYPEVYQCVPALIAIPPHTLITGRFDFENADLFMMPPEKLLDQSILLERLLIKYLRSRSITLEVEQ